MRQSTRRQAPRPVGPAAAAFSKMLSRAWSLPPQRNFVAIERNIVSQTAGKAAAHA